MNYITFYYYTKMTSEISQKAYEKQYGQLCKAAKSTDPTVLLEHILSKPVKETTKANNLNSIISLVKAGKLPEDGVEELRKARDELHIQIKKNVEADNAGKYRSKVDSVRSNHLNSMLSKLFVHRFDDTQSAEDWLLFSLMWPHPLRNDLQEITLCKNFKSRGKSNCIYIPKKASATGQLLINEHKTTSRGGDPIVKPLDSFQTQIAKQLFADGRTYLFQNKNGQSLSSSGFTNRLSKLTEKWLGIPISSTALRKIFLSNRYSSIKTQMREDAKLMGHSTGMQSSHYIDNKE
jgi:hypothetical protein